MLAGAVAAAKCQRASTSKTGDSVDPRISHGWNTDETRIRKTRSSIPNLSRKSCRSCQKDNRQDLQEGQDSSAPRVVYACSISVSSVALVSIGRAPTGSMFRRARGSPRFRGSATQSSRKTILASPYETGRIILSLSHSHQLPEAARVAQCLFRVALLRRCQWHVVGTQALKKSRNGPGRAKRTRGSCSQRLDAHAGGQAYRIDRSAAQRSAADGRQARPGGDQRLQQP